MIGSKILFAYRKRLINVRLENYLEIISVFDIAFLSHIAYTINTQKSQKRGGVSMATSSITHNFVVSNPNSVKRFVAAIDEADRDRTPKQTLPGRQLTNPKEILALMSKRKKKSCLINILPLIFGHIWIKTNRHISERKVFTTYSPIFLVPKNPDVEYFLLHNAIEFTKKDQSITYLVFDAEDCLHWLVIFHLQ